MWKNRLYKSVSRIFAALIIMSAQFAPAFLFVTNVNAAAPIKITAKSHQGQSSDSSYTSGNITTYTEGDSINFRFTLEANGTTSGDLEVRFTGDDSTCTFFDGSFVLGTHDSSAPTIENLSGVDPSVSTVGTPIATDFGTSNGEWVQTLHIDFSSEGEAIINYYITLSDEAGECNGSSQHSRLNPSGGTVSQTGAQNVPVPANQIIELPEIFIEKWVDTNGDGIVDRRATEGEWTFTLDGVTSLQTDSEGKVTFVNVTPDGNHTITESDGPADYAFIDGSGENCSFSNSVATANVVAGTEAQDATCIFNNGQQTGQIIVEKQTNPDGDTTDFAFTTDYSSTFTLKDGQTKSSGDLVPGTYSVSETVPTGWDQTSATCDDGSTPDSIQLEANETVTCTFTNTKRGSLTVEKTTYPSGDTTQFGITASGSGRIIGGGNGIVTDSTDKKYTVTPGTYSVAEAPIEGWEEVSNNCNDVVVEAGEDETCQIVNKKYASFTIIKDALPNSLQDFVFNGTNSLTGSYTLDDDEGVDEADNEYVNSKTFSLPSERVYTLTEVAGVEGWMLTDVECEGTGATANLELRNASFNLAPGATATCTFTNTKLAKILGSKFEVDANASNPEGLADWTINLINPDNDEILNTTKTDEFGGYSFENLLPGSYTIEEVLESGWTQITNDSGCEESYLITLVAGEVSEDNDFCNFKNGTIRGYKWNDKNGDGNVTGDDKLSGWTIFIDEDNNKELDIDEESTLTDENGVYEFDNLAPGTYDICEVIKANWVQTYPGTPTNPECHEIVVNESNTDFSAIKARSFGNQEYMKLTIVKNVVNDNGGTLDADDFGISISGFSDPVFGAPKSEDGDSKTYETSSSFAVPAEAITISEQDTTGYTEGSWVCSGTNGVNYDNENLSVDVTALGGEDVTCTITNDDIAPILEVGKQVINNNSGVLFAESFKLYVNGEEIEFKKGGGEVENSVAYGPYLQAKAGVAYTISEDEVEGYSQVGLECQDLDTELVIEHPVVLTLDQDVRCTITNDDVANPAIQVVKGGPEVAEAGTTVTYTFEVTNVGDVRLRDVEITDTITETPEYISGDLNEDDYLDLEEVWLFESTYEIPEDQVAPLVNVVTVCGSQFEVQEEEFLTYRATNFSDVEAVIGQSDVRVCDQDEHTTFIPQVLGDSITVEEPEVLAETGNSILAAILAGLGIVFLVAVLQKTVASDE